MNVCVVGLGRIGLPLAVHYASCGHRVVGCDTNVEVVQAVSAGSCPFEGEQDLSQRLAEVVQAGALRACGDTTATVRDSEVVVVIVPLTVFDDGDLDYRSLDAATRAVADGLRPATLVSYETTLPVGDTRQRLAPMLESSGLRAGKDFFLVHSPERVLVGRIFQDLARYPKVLGGLDDASSKAGLAFYRSVLDHVVQVRDAETAEFIKLAETSYRDANIALANQLALYASEVGVDIAEVIPVANSQPYSNILQPGIGVGGHCIPVYPHFIINRSAHAPLLRAARTLNDHMAEHALDLVRARLGELCGKRILILGLAFRENVKQASYSVSERLIRLLHAEGASVLLHDPLFSDDEIRRYGAEPIHLESDVTDADAAILQTNHDLYHDPAVLGRISGCRVLVDGRNVLDRGAVEALGIAYVGIGRPWSAGEAAPVGR